MDYSAAAGDNDKGYRLRAITGGTIYAIGKTGNADSDIGVKYIIIDGQQHDFGYLHIFQNGINYPITGIGDCKFVTLFFNIKFIFL
ncbi:MAG: hypothetical protein KA974_08475 [Saprospiraceae bacterium]|nr:hypothetical protein [Saprospiraceae bacterium]MBP7699189.1 hypothetical protein [Saprospiraceae bacterium]